MKNFLVISCFVGIHKWRYKTDGSKKKCIRCKKRVLLNFEEKAAERVADSAQILRR